MATEMSTRTTTMSAATATTAALEFQAVRQGRQVRRPVGGLGKGPGHQVQVLLSQGQHLQQLPLVQGPVNILPGGRPPRFH